jgi:PAS domain S-box-containing protein
MTEKSLNICDLNEAELRTELLRYRELFEYAPIGIVQTTVEGKILKANPAMADILGYDPLDNDSGGIGNIVEKLYAQPEKRQQLLELALDREELFNYETQFRRKDGEIITCRLHLRVVRGENGNVRFLESFVEDITDRKKTAVALLESEKLYRGIFENTGAGTIIIERDMTISFANTGFQRMTGYSKEEIEGRMRWTTFIADPVELDMMTQYHLSRRNQRHDVPIEYEFVLIDRLGIRKNIFLRVDIIAGTDRSVASLVDITSLKSARRSLHDSEARLKGLLEVFDGFIYTCTKNYILMFMNEALTRHLGRDGIGGICHQIIFGLDEPCAWCSQARVFSGESVKAEFKNPRDNRWYHMVSTPVYSGNETIQAKQNIMMDIHHRKQEEIEAKDREEYLRKENLRLRGSIQDRYRFGDIIGKSVSMQKVYELILRASSLDANVIVHGESGTGKELVAKAVHAMSDRGRHPFIPVNCGAIPEHLFESEFFGYKKGAFTGAHQDKPGYFDMADKGTLFLDELGEISLEMQVKLLRVLEGHSYHPVGGILFHKPDVRIITATNRNLHELIDKGKMREDFFYRIHIIPIHIPPLRLRKEDIPLLVEHFMEKYKTVGKQVPPIMGNTMDTMIGYDWPGNVRELENTIQRYMNLNTLDFFYAKSKPMVVGQGSIQIDAAYDLPLRTAMDRYEKDYISSLLHLNHWNRTKVARILGIERKTLYLKMKSLNISS